MTLSYQEVVAQVTAPGQPFEVRDTVVRGAPQTVFVNAPRNIGELFRNARRGGSRPFLVYEDEQWSFDRVMREADALAHALVHDYGVTKGDRVAIAMRNYPEWIVSFGAITSIGAISVSLNAMWTAEELDYAIADCGAMVVIADPQRVVLSLPTCERLGTRILAVRPDDTTPASVDAWGTALPFGVTMPEIDVEPDDDATILYTSGTTGHPKGAVSTHRAVLHALMAFQCRATVDRLRAPGSAAASSEPPVFILIVPLFHVTGCVSVMLSCVASSLKLVMMYKWDVDKALELIERERVTNFVGVPTQSWDLVHSPRFSEFDTSSLRGIGGGGAPAPPALVERVASTFKQGTPTIGYGMTETNAYGPQNNGADYLSHPTSAGRVVPIVRIDVRDPDGRSLPVGERGEIFFTGPNLIRGYWNRPDDTRATIVDGWLASGDLGRVDADGFVYVEDRAKDMILRAGENVYCAEVEAAIYEHPAIHEAAVFGVTHERLGEEVAVAVYPKVGHSITGDQLVEHLRPHIAAYMIPTHVFIVSEPLPRNAAGKFLKRQMREFAASHPA